MIPSCWGVTFSLVCGAVVPADTQPVPQAARSAPPGSASAEAVLRPRRPHTTFPPQLCSEGGEDLSPPPFSKIPSQRLNVCSREDADGVRVPHKQVLALVCLQHELGDAHARRGAALKGDGGRNCL